MRKNKVAYLGPPGSFTHQAAVRYFGNDVELIHTPAHLIPKNVKRGLRNVGSEERDHCCDYGVIAIENIAHGFIETTFNALYYAADVQIIGELYLPVKMNLISHAADPEKITHIVSHEVALSQCKKKIDKLESKYSVNYAIIPASSTSAAVQMANDNRKYAAIGSSVASETYKIPIIIHNLHDHIHNSTRFWILSSGCLPEREERNKTVFLVEIESHAGTLRRLLNLFADLGINITWIKQQIIPSKSNSKQWAYAFFIECEGHIRDKSLSLVYSVLRRKNLSIMNGRRARVVGSFPCFPAEEMSFS